ncbi:MAG TPA: cyclic peptide export ABC transporter [Pyrinomonadaceae bacterium]|nr:cyclic peptide export ABC transporter [Pyrinomonadaceae bacterium]
MKLVALLLRSSLRTVSLAVLAGIVAGVSNTGLLIIINSVLSNSDTPRDRLIWGFALLCLLMLVSRAASWIFLVQLAHGVTFKLRRELSARILAAPLQQLEKLGAPRLLATLTDDVSAIAGALAATPMLVVHIVVVVTCLGYLGWLSLPALLGVFAFLLVGVLCYQLPLRRALSYLGASRHELDALLKNFRSLIEGNKELKLHRARREAFFHDQLEEAALSFRRKASAGDAIYALTASFGHLLIFILIGLLIFVLPVLQPTETATTIGYSLVILYLMPPLEVIMNALPALGRANVALQKIEAMGLSLAAKSVERSTTISSPSHDYQSLKLEGVTHSYDSEDGDGFQLGPVDLSFRPAELVFLVGGNGSGKTTLAKILTGLYAPDQGAVYLDGEKITDETRDQYRQLFAAVFSDFHLFESLLGLNAGALDQQALQYLRRLQLDRKVQVIEGVLSTTDLSHGQRKRLALLTAYLEDRPFYVFDEWAADQDPLFKEIFYLRLLPELKARGKTVIVISHDDRYFHVADRILKLNYGKMEQEILTSLKSSVVISTS